MRYPKISGALIATWDIEVKLPLEKIWDYISNTDRINKAIGSGAVEYKEIPNENGGSLLFGQIKNSGIVSEYRELPYEWVENQFVSVHRTYHKGPLKTMTFDMEIIHTSIGFTARYTMQFELTSFLFRPIIWLELHKKAIPKFRETFQHLERFFDEKESVPLPVHGFKPRSKEILTKKNFEKRFANVSTNFELKDKIINFILDSPDADLIKIKPYKLARAIKEDRRKTLEFFLRSTKEGLFDMNWDILCPSCRGAKASSNHLFDLKEEVHCPTCNIEYGPDFDKSVELTFTPNPSLLKVEASLHCFGGPGITPHLRAQIRVKEQSKESIQFNFQEGKYRIFSLQESHFLTLDVKPHHPKIEKIEYPRSGELLITTGKAILEFSNNHEYEILIKLEKANWLDEIVTASEVTAMQEFRDLFSSEVLKPGQEIGIQSISILFTDLKGSTKFYNDKGDALAYKIVREHFDILIANAYKHQGAIVKTIGDSVMAVFTLPIHALRYAIDAQIEIRKLHQKHEITGTELKIGINHGPVLAVTMNEKLDYFGTTVNLAARTQGQSEGGDIVITQDFFLQEGIENEIRTKSLSFENFTAQLKGFSESYKMIRIRL